MNLNNGIPIPGGQTLFPLNYKKINTDMSYLNGLPKNIRLFWNKGLLIGEAIISNNENINNSTSIFNIPFGIFSTDNINSNISLLKILNGSTIISSDEFLLYGGINGFYKLNETFKLSIINIFENLFFSKIMEEFLLKTNKESLLTPNSIQNEISFLKNKLYIILSNTINYIPSLREEYTSFNISTYSNIISFSFLNLFYKIKNYIVSVPNNEKINIDQYLNLHETLYFSYLETKRNNTVLKIDSLISNEINNIINNQETFENIISISQIINNNKINTTLTMENIIKKICYILSGTINFSIMMGLLHSEANESCKTDLYFNFIYPEKYKNLS